MLLSEMVLDGIVIDIGHEMTQIVPFIDGRASYHKTSNFPVGGLFVDYIMQNYLFFHSGEKIKVYGDSLHFNYAIQKLRES